MNMVEKSLLTQTAVFKKRRGIRLITREVTFCTELGIKLSGLLHFPAEKNKGKRPGVVLCHGFGGIREMAILPMAEWLTRAGFVALVFDYRGFGRSDGQPRNRLIPMEQVEDIRNALSYMQMQPEVDPKRVGVCGLAFGGANAVYTAAVDTRVKCAVSISGIGDVDRAFRNVHTLYHWRKLLAYLEESRKVRVSTGIIDYIKIGKVIRSDPVTLLAIKKLAVEVPNMPTEITTDSVEAILQYKPESVVSKIAPRPIMWIHSKDDNLLSYEESLHMYGLASEPKKLILLEGYVHYDIYEDIGLKATMGPTTEWFEEHL